MGFEPVLSYPSIIPIISSKLRSTPSRVRSTTTSPNGRDCSGGGRPKRRSFKRQPEGGDGGGFNTVSKNTLVKFNHLPISPQVWVNTCQLSTMCFFWNYLFTTGFPQSFLDHFSFAGFIASRARFHFTWAVGELLGKLQHIWRSAGMWPAAHPRLWHLLSQDCWKTDQVWGWSLGGAPESSPKMSSPHSNLLRQVKVHMRRYF